jgi:hypothetical protein
MIGAQIIGSDSTNIEARINQATQNTPTNTLPNPSFQLLATTARTMEKTNKISGDTANAMTKSGIRCA